MKLKLIILSAATMLFFANYSFAYEGMNHDEMAEEKGSMMEHKGSMMEEHNSELPNVGNKICPVSGKLIADVGDGKGVQVEYDGKVYNVCCKMCAKDFKKNPEKYRKIAEEEVAGSEHGEKGDDEDREKTGSHHE